MAGREPTLSPQPWPWPGPRVLIEHDDEARADAVGAALRNAGYAVAVCPGPTAADRCPLAGEDGCAAAHGADAIVSSLGLATPEAREALAALRAHVPDVPLVVEAATAEADEWPLLVQGCRVVPPGSPEQVVAEVRTALERKATDAA